MGEIFGILRQMKETFDANLASSQKEEAENQKAYAELKAAKEDEIAAGQAQIESKTDELAETDEKNAQAKLEMEAVSKALSVLSGDDAHNLFTKTFNPAFLQS